MTRIAHVDLVVEDVERALAFYVGVLGCRVADDAIVRMPSLALLTGAADDQVRVILLQLPGPGVGKSTIELMAFPGGRGEVPVRFGSDRSFVPSLWSFSLVVDELEPFLAKLAEAGVPAVTPIDVIEMPRAGRCRIAFVRDPDGNLIELIDVPKRAADGGPAAAPR